MIVDVDSSAAPLLCPRNLAPAARRAPPPATADCAPLTNDLGNSEFNFAMIYAE